MAAAWLSCAQTWWLCISSCCFSSSSNWACWVALVGSDWLEHWRKRIIKVDFNKRKKMAEQSANVHVCITTPVATWARLTQDACEDPPPQISLLLSPHCSALSALTAQSSAAWSPHLHCCEWRSTKTLRNWKTCTSTAWQGLMGKWLTLV